VSGAGIADVLDYSATGVPFTFSAYHLRDT